MQQKQTIQTTGRETVPTDQMDSFPGRLGGSPIIYSHQPRNIFSPQITERDRTKLSRLNMPISNFMRTSRNRQCEQ